MGHTRSPLYFSPIKIFIIFLFCFLHSSCEVVWALSKDSTVLYSSTKSEMFSSTLWKMAVLRRRHITDTWLDWVQTSLSSFSFEIIWGMEFIDYLGHLIEKRNDPRWCKKTCFYLNGKTRLPKFTHLFIIQEKVAESHKRGMVSNHVWKSIQYWQSLPVLTNPKGEWLAHFPSRDFSIRQI